MTASRHEPARRQLHLSRISERLLYIAVADSVTTRTLLSTTCKKPPST